MPKLRLTNANYDLDLNGVAATGRGYQATVGANGFGFPTVSTQWIEGAGDGAAYRGQRVLPRDLDIPLWIEGVDAYDLQKLVSELGVVTAAPCTLWVEQDDLTAWSADVVRMGGGGYVMGQDNTETTMSMVLTFRAGEPYFKAKAESEAFTPLGSAGGSIRMNNYAADVDTPVKWVIDGPCTAVTLTSPSGETLTWTGTLIAGDALTIDGNTSRVTDSYGESRYDGLNTAPRLWKLPPGVWDANVAISGATASTQARAYWRPRRRFLI